MLYQPDSHSTPILYIANNNRIEIPFPEDSTHVVVKIRTTGPGGDGVPAEVRILRNSGESALLFSLYSILVMQAQLSTNNIPPIAK